MNEIPAGAGNDDPRRRLGTADGETNLIGTGLSSFSRSAPARKCVSVNVRRLDSGALGGERRQSRLADFTSKAAATLRSARGGVPASSGAAAVTADRREANERRCGGGERSPSCGWRGVAERLHAMEGATHE